ncbi:MAG: arginase family protein [Sedimentitalea sp.]|nr:arginase family protein [Sedimentitalea sp.]
MGPPAAQPRSAGAEISRDIGDRLTYLTCDIDGLNPAFTAGTGTHEIGGCELVERSPTRDPPGDTVRTG